MSESRFPVDLPPGIYHNGTRNQAEGRWYDGNGVRFYQGTKQPIGGWVQRTLTGATIAGTPNAAVSWVDNNEANWLAIGTSTNLYVVDGANVVHDITPATLNGDAPHIWSLSVFGQYLLAVSSYATFVDQYNFYVWKADPATPAVFADGGTGTLPIAVFGVVTTPERFCVLLRGSDPVSAQRRAPTGGAIFDPTGGAVTFSQQSGTPTPVGGAVFDPTGGGLVF